MKCLCWILTITGSAGSFPLVLKITQLNTNCDLFVIRTHSMHPASVSSMPSDSFQEIRRRRNTFLIKTEFMQARAQKKSSNHWFWYLESLFHYCSMIFKINVLLLQVQSKYSQNANFVFKVGDALQRSSQLTRKNARSLISTSVWESYLKYEYWKRKVFWRTASHKEHRSSIKVAQKLMECKISSPSNLILGKH